MPEVRVEIGDRTYKVACQDGEEHSVQSAANLLNSEASALTEQSGAMPEIRMLLLAGLMTADKTATLEADLRAAQERVEAQAKELEALKSAKPERVEVPVIPRHVTDSLTEIADRSEALADRMDVKDA